ncbi:MAG: polysaccharide biosynthesis/export family protein [Acidobacteriota bacterium]|mgnify:CR=1 FL=1
MRGLFDITARLAFCLLAAGWLLAAQQKPQQTQPPSMEPLKETGTDPATSAPAPVDPKLFVIGPEDILMIRVWREPEHSGLVTVRPDGMITLPLVGDIRTGGMTPEKLDAEITRALSKYITAPDVLVSVQSVRSRRYYVSGEVNRPSAFPLVVRTTVLEALTLAGGFREWANKKDILIIRGGNRLKFNYKDVVRGKKPDVPLESGDHIVVP